MFKSDYARRITVAACTLVMSATCVLGAVGPAASGPVRVATPIVLTA